MTRRRRSRFRRLFLQALEDRTVPAVYTVLNGADAGGGSLRAALDAANLNADADTIQFDPGFATASTTIVLATPLSVLHPVSVLGPGAKRLAVSGNNLVRVFDLGGAAAGTAIALFDLSIEKGAAVKGAGVLLSNQSLTLTRVHVRGNTAGLDGGGVFVSGGGSLNAHFSAFTGNAANYGGAIDFFNLGGTLDVRNSTLSGNTAAINGGAVYFNGNVATAFAIRNSTITANSAGTGGGLHRSVGTGTMELQSSIVFGNFGVAPDISCDPPVAVNYSAVGAVNGFSIAAGGVGNLAAGTDVKLAALAENGGPTPSHHPAPTSPAVNGGKNYSGSIQDQRGTGYFRLEGVTVDIGAIEADNVIVRNAAASGPGSLVQAVLDANALPGTNTIRFDTFDAQVFSVPQTIVPAGTLAIASSLVIEGPGANRVTVSGNNAFGVIDITSAAAADVVTLRGLTIANGLALHGAGIAVGDESLVIEYCHVTANTTTADFSDGGGILVNNGGSVAVRNSAITHNRSHFGAAIDFYPLGGSLLVENSTLSGNTATISGGGIYFHGTPGAGGYTLRNSTITANSSQNGSGVFSTGSGKGGNLAIDSSVIAGNVSGSTDPEAHNVKISNLTPTINHSALGGYSNFDLVGSANLPIGIDFKLGPLALNGGAIPHHMPAIDSPLREQGSNPGLNLDQRGFARQFGAAVDVGAVEVHTATLTNITWGLASQTVTSAFGFFADVADKVNGFAPGNFLLTGPAAAGAAITAVTELGGGKILVSGTTGADGVLGLSMVSDDGLTHRIVNLPVAHTSPNFVDQTPLATLGIAVSDAMLTDADVGYAKFTLTATYSEAMDPATSPVFSFPAVGENPAGSIAFSSGGFISPTQYRATFNVNDLNVHLNTIDVGVSFGKDTLGKGTPFFVQPDLFTIDTRNPTAVSILRNDANPTKAATVNWTVHFSEALTGLTQDNFSLFNGGLTGSPAITALNAVTSKTYTVTASTGSGEGNLVLVVDNGAGATDANGNYLANTPISGGGYAVDHVSPAASKLTLSTLVVSDANVGPNGFTATLKFNELMDQGVNPSVSFPAEFPNSLTFNGGVWLDAQTYQAKFNVADLGVEQADIDIRFTGGQDLVGNVQTQFDAIDVFDIDTQNAIVSSITSASPNATYTIGQNVDVTLNFSEAVNLVGTLNVTLDTGAVVSIVGPASGTSLNGTYTVGAGESSADLNVTAIALTGGSTLKDAATNNSVLTLPGSNLANNAAIVINGGATVTGFVVNNTDTQRSRITRIVVTFSGSVNAATLAAVGGITLTRTTATPGGTVGTVVDASNGLIVTPAVGSANSVTLTFDNIANAGVEFASLADGYWRLAVPSLSYQSTLYDPALRRLFGDFDANGTVDGAVDFPAFGNDFNVSGVSPFDFNNDGIVDGAIDFPAFGANFNRTL